MNMLEIHSFVYSYSIYISLIIGMIPVLVLLGAYFLNKRQERNKILREKGEQLHQLLDLYAISYREYVINAKLYYEDSKIDIRDIETKFGELEHDVTVLISFYFIELLPEWEIIKSYDYVYEDNISKEEKFAAEWAYTILNISNLQEAIVRKVRKLFF